MFKTNVLTVLLAGFVSAVGCLGSQAPSSIPEPQTERAGSWEGRIEVLVVDGFPAGSSRIRLFLRTPEEVLELETDGADVLRPGQMVKVTGRTSGKRLVVAQANALAEDTGPGSCSAIGEQKTAVILASFPSKALLSSVTPELMRESFFGAGPTLDNFLRESSFGQTWTTGDVLGPFVLDADYFDEPLSARDAALRAAAASADLTKYNRIFVVAPQGEMGMDSGGMALLGCGPISSPQGTLYASSMWLGAESMVAQTYVVETAAHEIGHGFGLEHARLADFGADPLGPAGQSPAPWDSLHEYGDSFSNMGRQSAQWAAPQKELLGWLQAGTNVQTVSAAGSFSLSPYEAPGNSQALRISRGAGGDDWLWLEYRQPQGTVDATLPAEAFAGALAHYQDPALTATLSGVDPATYTNLVNFHPAAGFATDPTLHAGETWNDPYGSLSLTVTSATAAGLTVSVSYSAAPVCASSAGASQSFDSAGGAGELSVTAPGSCSWSAATSAPWISLGAPGSGTGNGVVSFTVAENVNVSPRWGKIAAGDAFAIVTQAGSAGWVSISPQTYLAPATGGDGEISLATSSPDFAWTMGWDAPWITDVECSCFLDVGPATIRYIVAANTGPERTGTITVGGLAFTVTQPGGAPNPDGPSWNLLAPLDAPAARHDMAMAAFGHSGQAVLYGGVWDTTMFADTWLWDGSNWTSLHPAHSPGLLSGHAMAYDEARGQIVLFGGESGDTYSFSNQTWVWDGSDWRQMQPAVSPPARMGHAMAYDPVSHSVVLFGGSGNYGDTNDTWTWDGSNWTQAVSAQSPMPRSGHSMAFDASRSEMVLFGGFHFDGVPTWFSDTWVRDASGWRQMFSATPPAARSGHVLAYDTALRSILMIGGSGGKDITASSWNYDFRKETWMWDGQEWVQQFPEDQPGAAYSMGVAYDDSKQSLTVHVGDDLTCASRGPKTYLLGGSSPKAFHVPKPPAHPSRPVRATRSQ